MLGESSLTQKKKSDKQNLSLISFFSFFKYIYFYFLYFLNIFIDYAITVVPFPPCLLYTSDAADDQGLV